MKNFSINYFTFCLQILILPAFLLSACKKPQIQFGQAYVNDNYSNIVLVDTLSAAVSTVFRDSVITSGSSTALVGNFNDTYFGKISASSFVELTPPSLAALDPKAVYDSLVLIMIPNKSYYGDTTQGSKISVYQLTNPINFPLYQTEFYNNSNFPVNPTPLGSSTTTIYPNFTDSVFVRLDDNKGNELFNLYNSGDYSMQTTNSFINYFSGLKITSGSGGMKAIYGFKDSVTMRLYYHINGLFNTPKKLDFKFYNGDNKQFNQVLSDRTGTPLAAFGGADQEIPSSSTNNSAYLQYLTGFIPKIKFPTLRKLLLKPDFLKIIRAEIILTPVNQSYNGYTILPPQLYAYTTDQSNYLGSPLPSPTGSGYQYGSLVIDPLYNANTNYIYDVTAYLQQLITVAYVNQNGLLLIPPSPASISNFNRFIMGDQNNSGGTLQLKVYYVSSNL